MVPHNRLTFDRKEGDAVKRIVNGGYWAGGAEVKKLEKEIARVTKRKYVVGVSSGLSALRLVLLALQVGKGDEVIIPAYCCVALANAVLACGARPIPADINNVTLNIDFDSIKFAVTNRTKAIIAVNTFGRAADIQKIKRLGIPIIEDCAHALGKIDNGYTYGKAGIVSVASFYATKLVGGGEGGAVMTDSKAVAEFVADYRDYTDKQPSGLRLNEKMSNIDAALILCQIAKLPAFIEKRQRVAGKYNTFFSKLKERFPGINFPGNENRIWYRYIISVSQIKAESVVKALYLKGVTAHMPVENWLGERAIARYPNAQKAYKEMISLPIYPTLTAQEIKTVMMAVTQTIQQLDK